MADWLQRRMPNFLHPGVSGVTCMQNHNAVFLVVVLAKRHWNYY